MTEVNNKLSTAGAHRFRDLIRVDIGTGGAMESFSVCADALIDRSPFFPRVLSGDWKEAEERHIKLRDDDVDTFTLYLDTVHGNDLFSNPDFTSPRQSPDSKLRAQFDRRNGLLKLWVFAEKISDVRAKNASLTAYMKCIWGLVSARYFWLEPTPQEITTIYEGTMPRSPMRRLVLDMYALPEVVGALLDKKRECPQEFLYDMTSELLTSRWIRQGYQLKFVDGPEHYLELNEIAKAGRVWPASPLKLLSEAFQWYVGKFWRKVFPCSCRTRRTKSTQGPVSNVE